MNQMVMLSTLMHFAFIGILSVFPVYSSKKTTYTPVYTVNLISLPPAKKATKAAKIKKAIKPTRTTKAIKPAKKKVLTMKKKFAPKTLEKKIAPPINLLSGQKKSAALAKLKSLEKDFEKDESPKKENEIEEKEIPEMFAAFDKLTKMENESGFIFDSEERQNKILDRLNKMEQGMPEAEKEEESNIVDFEKTEKPTFRELFEKIEKKWEEENEEQQPFSAKDETSSSEVLEKLASFNEPLEKLKKPDDSLGERIGTSAPLSSQNIRETPSYLSVYFALIQNKIKAQWKNPSGAEILSETETNKKATVSFNIIRSGRIEDYKIKNSSGNRVLDNLALMAVKNADHLPPLPSDYHEKFLRVYIDFNYSIK